MKTHLAMPKVIAAAGMAAILSFGFNTTAAARAEVAGGAQQAPLRITPKMIQQAAAPAPRSQAILTREDDEEARVDLFKASGRNLDDIPNACKNGSGSLCFDYRTGRTVYKPMRKLLPEIPGMTPHNLSLRRDRLVAHYTFK